MPNFYARLGKAEILPRYIFVESLFARRRVLEVGAVAATAGETAAFLRERGARHVVAVDDDAGAIAGAQKAHASDPDLKFVLGPVTQLPPAAFDLVAVADIAPVLRHPASLHALASFLARTGHLLVGLRNPAGVTLSQVVEEETGEAPPTYGEMVSILQNLFPSVEVATQSILVGYQLAPAAPTAEEAIAVDGSLAQVDEAAYFLAVCGQRPAHLGDQALVPLPSAPIGVAAQARAELAEREKLGVKRATEAIARGADLTRALGDRNRDVEDLQRNVGELAAELEQERARAREAESLGHRGQTETIEVKARIRDAEQLVAQRNRDLEALRTHYNERSAEVARLGEELKRAKACLAESTTAIEDAARTRAHVEEKVREKDVDLGAIAARLEEARTENERLRGALSQAESRGEGRDEELEKALARAAEAEAAAEAVRREQAEDREGLRTARDAAQAEAAAAQKAVADRTAELDLKLSRTRESGEAARARIVDLESELAAAAEARRRVEAAATQVREMADALEAEKARSGRLERDVETVASAERAARSEADVATARARRLERDVETVATSERAARDRFAQLEAELAEAQPRRAALEADLAAAHAALDGATAALKEALAARERIEQTAQGAAEAQSSQAGETAMLRSQVERAVNERTALEQRVGALTARVQDLEGERERAGADLAAVRADADAARAETERARAEAAPAAAAPPEESEAYRRLAAEKADLEAKHTAEPASRSADADAVQRLTGERADLEARLLAAEAARDQTAEEARRLAAERGSLESRAAAWSELGDPAGIFQKLADAEEGARQLDAERQAHAQDRAAIEKLTLEKADLEGRFAQTEAKLTEALRSAEAPLEAVQADLVDVAPGEPAPAAAGPDAGRGEAALVQVMQLRDELLQKNAQLRASFEAAEAKAVQLEQVLAQTRAGGPGPGSPETIEKLEAEMAVLRDRSEALEASEKWADTLAKQLSIANAKHGDAERESADLKRRLDAAMRSVQKLAAEIQKATGKPPSRDLMPVAQLAQPAPAGLAQSAVAPSEKK